MNQKLTSVLLLSFFAYALFAQDTKKILIIGIDGCRPDVLQFASTPNIDGLLPNSIYSYHGLNNDITYSGPGWSAMMTGVWSNKHGVTDNNFNGSDFVSYPHFVKRIEENNPDLYTVSISQWHPINNSIVLDFADFKYNAPTEADVTSEAINQLENEDPDVMFLHYDEVDHAGHAHGFSEQIPQYVTAIEGVDTQVGLVLDALYERPNYPTENWLILLSTDHGGIGTSHGGNSPEEETIFYIAHNENFVAQIITPDTIAVTDPTDCIANQFHLSLDGDDDMVDIPHFTELDFGVNQDFTVECRVKTSNAADIAIIGNKDWDSGGNKGFVFSFRFATGPEWKVNIGDGANRVDINDGGAIADNEWHHLAVTFDRDGQMTMYEDGVLVTSLDISAIGDISNGSPLRIGADIDGGYDYTGAIEEVRLWNGLITPAEINTWKCTSIDNTHPSYNNLIGYWPLNEGSGNLANDISALDNDGIITNPNWSALDSVVTYENTPKITDIAITALDWLCLDLQQSWNLDGRSWIDSSTTIMATADEVPGSLRSTINNSCAEDSIYFHPILNGSDFVLTSEIEIPHNLTLIGSGISETSLSANYQNRLFLITHEINFNLTGMTLQKANETINGGAIYNQGNLLLKEIVFKDNFEGSTPKTLTNIRRIKIENVVEVKN